MRKIIDIMAVASFVVSAAVVGGGVYLYTQKDALVDNVKERAAAAIGEMVGDAVSDGLTGAMGGAAPSAPGASELPVPTSLF